MPKGVYERTEVHRAINRGRYRPDMIGEKNPNWKGGESVSSGYKVDSKHRYVHREIWIKNFGAIPKGYIIHHKDDNKFNNDISNLECMSRANHIKLHDPLKWRIHTKNNMRKCKYCNKIVKAKNLCSAHYTRFYRQTYDQDKL